ncbi:MAG: ATP-dependent RecD-like DNA helicase, partial [Cyclobacteriaceae bacterium]
MEDLLDQAARFINTTSSHIFLTGKAGTGKTTFLKNLKSHTHKNFIVVAPTGIAALIAGGVTIHSQFLLPPGTFLPDRFLAETVTDQGRVLNEKALARKHPITSARKLVLRSIDLLVIDEVSMLRADLLDAIDYRMKAARGNFRRSFGGAQVLFIGDLFQLPPVVRSDEQEMLGRYYKSPWFYEAHALRNDPPIYIELQKIFRQQDEDFITLLNHLRNNEVTEEDINVLNRHVKPAAEIRELKEVITLTTHNYKADEINQHELRALKTPTSVFDAFIEGEFPENMYPARASLELKAGAQIMFIRNDPSDERKYVNGKLATVLEIKRDEVWVQLADTHE